MSGSQGSLSEQAYSALKKKLLTLESGAYLSARQFASETSMSYTPVREAFLRLQSEGMLKQIPSVGFFMATMDVNDMIQSFQARECIEPFVLQKVFPRITDKHIAQMREYSREQHKALTAEDIVQYMKFDIKLHEVLLDLYGNPHLKSLYHTVREKHMFCSNRIALSFQPGALEEHTKLIDAFESGDIDLSLQLLNSHIESAKQRMMEGFINVIG